MKYLGMGLILGVLAIIEGCASIPPHEDALDPLVTINRYSYAFNDGVDRAILKPVSKGYKKYFPNPVKKGVRNFFNNLGEPLTIFNQVLQGKVQYALSDLMRFTFNSTFGLVGIFDVATDWSLPEHTEDFGQTLGVWGVGQGPYLMLPLLGPSNLRDLAGFPVNWSLNPTTYAPPSTTMASNVLDTVSVRADLLETTQVLDETSIDKYVSVREAYRQLRWSQVYDGNPPEPDFFDELFTE